MKLCFFIFFLLSQNSNAQLDPSSGLLLNSDAKASTRTNGLDSGRYTVKPHQDTTGIEKKKFSQAKANDKLNDKNSDTNHEDSDGDDDAPVPTPVAPVIESKQPEKHIVESTGPVTTQTAATELPTPNLASPVDEKKLNLVELSVAPSFIYNHSSSDLSFRNYSTSNLAYSVDVSAWLQKNFALHGQLINSLAGSINDSYDHTRNAGLTQQWITAGVRFRNFNSNKRNANSLVLGLDYEDYQFQVDSDAHIRNRLETSGVKLSLLSEIPQSTKYSWELGVSFMPKAKHQETPTTANLQSGDSPESDLVSLSLGGRIYIDSSNQMFWKVSEIFEKNQYLGTTSKADPATSQSLSNVSVANTFTLIQIGYTWGN